MFTGIVRDVGEVRAAERGSLEIATALPLPEVGASVAVNGACLTVVRAAAGCLAFDLSHETLERTNLGLLRPGDPVNLEPALTLQQPLDGHLVQGHVDGTGTVREWRPRPLETDMSVELPKPLARFVAEKGSVAVDGASLTVTGVDGHSFAVALIPHTLQHTIAGRYERGTVVNLEVDLVARYVERLLAQ